MRAGVRRSGFGRARLGLAGLFLLSLAGPAVGEEGMWTFDNPPLRELREKYGFAPDQAWLDHVRLASVRFNDGGSGSFVSPHGLVLTNHHVASGQLGKVSSPGKDFVKNGFYAGNAAEELKCPDLELNVLLSMEEVTKRVQGVVREGMEEAEALKARQAEMARIEKESLEVTGLRSDVVALYHGGEYWLYRSKKYTDVRIVFAPESAIAYFGGDPDNFTFPRHNLDMALFRVYENGKPVESRHYLKWNAGGLRQDDLVFVSGHPASTSRLKTVAQLETERDYEMPYALGTLRRRRGVLNAYAAQGPEEARQAAGRILGAENSIKARTGMAQGLSDPAVMAKKRAEEKALRSRIDAHPEWARAYGRAWSDIARAQKKHRQMFKQHWFRRLRGARLPDLALTLVQYVAEVKKPDGERLEEFHEAGLESLRFRLLSPAPVYPKLEEAMLADSLQESLEALGPEDPFVRAALDGRSPVEVAAEVIGGTRLADPDFRRSLLKGGEAAVAASDDPLIALARRVDPIDREMTRWYEDGVESVEVAGGEKIGRARFAVYGKSAYPDATFTLRLTYGTVKGYPMNGTQAPTRTTLYGLFDRAFAFGMKPPYDLPSRFLERRGRLDLSTPLNFVSTTDVTGGNSGSPVVNRDAELVGLIFDGNIDSLVGEYVYDVEKNRSIAVAGSGMGHLLRKLYGAGGLADELEGKSVAAAKAKQEGPRTR